MDTAFPAVVHAVDKAWQEAAAECHQEYPELAYSTIQIIPAKDDTLGLDAFMPFWVRFVAGIQI